MRAKKIIGNWKMYKTRAEAEAFVASLALVVVNNPMQIGLAVPFTLISVSAQAARGSSITIGAQNMNEEEEGAFTGEISCRMLKDAGATFVLIGHSERRRLFFETEDKINLKLKKALSHGMQVILCIGETLEEYQQNKTQEILRKQLMQDLHGIPPEQMSLITLAYEPVWAIGTGQSATPEVAQQAHHFCRRVVEENWGKKIADHLVIQYGGSVKAENSVSLLDQPDIDGFLVGNASLSLDAFVKIVQSQQIISKVS